MGEVFVKVAMWELCWLIVYTWVCCTVPECSLLSTQTVTDMLDFFIGYVCVQVSRFICYKMMCEHIKVCKTIDVNFLGDDNNSSK